MLMTLKYDFANILIEMFTINIIKKVNRSDISIFTIKENIIQIWI